MMSPMEYFIHTKYFNTKNKAAFQKLDELKLTNIKRTFRGRIYQLATYTKKYPKAERVKRFIQALFITVGTLGIALFDQRARQKWLACLKGRVTKNVAIEAKAQVGSKGKFIGLRGEILIPESENSKRVGLAKAIHSLNNKKSKGDVGLFITSNEIGLKKSKKSLQDKPQVSNSCHIGCASWHNLDIMAQRKSSFGVIFDCNPLNKELMEKTFEILEVSDTRQIFQTKMLQYLKSVPKDRFGWNRKERVHEEKVKRHLTKNGSWLSSDENFEFIKSLCREGKIIPISETIQNSSTFKKLAKILKKNSLVVDTVYLSNMRAFMKSPKKRKGYVRSLNALISDDTLVIHCPRKAKGKDDKDLSIRDFSLRQEVIKGKELHRNPNRYFITRHHP